LLSIDAKQPVERREFPDGIAFIRLAPLNDSAWVVPTVAAALGVREEAGHALVDHLLSILASRRLLIVLDNCEHVIEASADLVNRMLQSNEYVRIIATSREPLRVSGEQTYALAPLSLPETESLDVHGVAASEAVHLFVTRAQESSRDFRLSADNATSIATICRRLDGIPLAIEIAASRVFVLGVDEIAAGLDNRFELLRSGARVGPARHQTLAAAVQWSYDLLSPAEQSFFEELSELAGTWTLEAAAAVTNTSQLPSRRSEAALDLLAQLVAKSMVIAQPPTSGPRRYRQLETLRDFGRGRLMHHGGAEMVRDRLVAYCIDLAERAEANLRGPAAAEWSIRLTDDHDNVRAALSWSIERGEVGSAYRLVAALWRFWYLRGFISEGWVWTSKVLGLPESGLDDRLLARVLFGGGMLAYYRSDLASAVALSERALLLARARHDDVLAARILAHLGMLARTQRDFAAARPLLRHGLSATARRRVTRRLNCTPILVGWSISKGISRRRMRSSNAP
jgi:predicted ATPase